VIRLKRAYDSPDEEDGRRYLVDRLWPRGVKKEDLRLEDWLKEVTPSDQLRDWFGHEPEKWQAFKQRYFAELDEKPETWQTLLDAAEEGDITLVYAATDEQHNNAVALKEYLQSKRR